MTTVTHSVPASGTAALQSSRGLLWTGHVLSTLLALFMLMDAGMKLAKPPFVVEATVKLGYSEQVIVPLGVVLLVSTILYIIPATAVLGAILLTGYLGGAVATHVLVWEGWFPVLFPVVFGVVAWLGLVLRDAQLRSLLPLRRGIRILVVATLMLGAPELWQM